MSDESSVGLPHVEPVAIVHDNDIGPIEDIMECFDKLPIVLLVLLVTGEVRESKGMDFLLAQLLPGKG